MKLAATPAVGSVQGKSSAPRRVQSRAGEGSVVGGGRGSQVVRYCPPARLASCRLDPWASSGAPCPPPCIQRPLSSHGPPRVSAARAAAVAAGLALGSPWGEEVGG